MSKFRQKLSRLLHPKTSVPYDKSAAVSVSASCKSHQLLQNRGFIRQQSPGYFHILPLGFRCLNKLIKLVEKEMDSAGGQRMNLPLLTPSKFWSESGRIDSMGPELMKISDRRDKEFVIGPTYEESVAGLFADINPSHKTLPLKLYQISGKFRDEISPRYGLLRSNEFLMKDLYSFDKDDKSSRETYEEVTRAYCRIFEALEIPYKRVEGASGDMGGSVNHEFHFVTSEIGQDSLTECSNCQTAFNSQIIQENNKCPKCSSTLPDHRSKGIEVGHTFLLGDKYSGPLKANFVDRDGKNRPSFMGCYGLGLSRIFAASAEVLSTDKDLIWPKIMAPFDICLIIPKTGSKEFQAASALVEAAYDGLTDAVIDDRSDMTIGNKLRHCKKDGFTFNVVFGKASVKDSDPEIEVHHKEICLRIHPDDLSSCLSSFRTL